MIKQFFSNHKYFAWLYFAMLLIDILVKLNLPSLPYRFMSKPLLMLLLLVYFFFNKVGGNNKRHRWVFLALLFFLLGDLTIIFDENIMLLGLSALLFSLGKLFFCAKFSHKKEFNLSRLVPFFSILFIYVVFIVAFLYVDIKPFIVPAFITFFSSLLVFKFTYLRKDAFNKKSYRSSFFGVLLFILSESLMAVVTFKFPLPFHDFLIMMLYGSSVYFIIFGIINEKEYEQLKVEEFLDDI